MMNYVKFFVLIILIVSCNVACQSISQTTEEETDVSGLRAPAYPLITVDPYFSAWSTTDQLFDDAVRHWTGRTIGRWLTMH